MEVGYFYDVLYYLLYRKENVAQEQQAAYPLGGGCKEIFLRLHSPPSRQKQQLFGRAV